MRLQNLVNINHLQTNRKKFIFNVTKSNLFTTKRVERESVRYNIKKSVKTVKTLNNYSI